MKKLMLLCFSLLLVVSFSGCLDPGFLVEQNIKGNFVPDSQGIVEIEIVGRNGSIEIVPVSGGEFNVEMDLRVQTTTRSQAEELVEEKIIIDHRSGMFMLSIEDERIGARIKAEVPKDLIYNVDLVSSNGSLTLKDIVTQNVSLRTSNGSLNLSDVDFDVVRGRTSNGSLRVEGVNGDILELETSNGSVDVDGLARVFDIRSSNSSMDIKPFFPESDGLLKARTSNGNITVSILQVDDLGYEITGSTSNGRIDYSKLEGFIKTQRQNRIQSENLELKSRIIDIDLSTSNGNIEVKPQ